MDKKREKIIEELSLIVWVDIDLQFDFILINKWHNKHINFENALELLKEDNFYTVWNDFIIIDKDKYSAKEMLRFILETEEPPVNSNIKYYLIWFIIFLILLAIWIYVTITSDSDDIIKTNTTNTVELISDPIIKNEDKEDNININSSDTNNLFNSDSINNYENNNLSIWNTEILNSCVDNLDEQIKYNDLLLNDFNNYKDENKYIYNENIDLLNENKLLSEKINELESSVIWDITPLQNYLGIKLYERCKDSSDNTCNRLFYYFYNQN